VKNKLKIVFTNLNVQKKLKEKIFIRKKILHVVF